MDVVEFLLAKHRLCDGSVCKDCILDDECDAASFNCVVAKNMVKKVEWWAKEHPVKTRQSEFLKMFPDTKIIGGCINILPCDINYHVEEDCTSGTWHMECAECRRNYWLQEVD